METYWGEEVRGVGRRGEVGVRSGLFLTTRYLGDRRTRQGLGVKEAVLWVILEIGEQERQGGWEFQDSRVGMEEEAGRR